MARRKLPPSEYDQGYFRLCSDGSFTTHFRALAAQFLTARAYAEVDLATGEYTFPECPAFPENDPIRDLRLLAHCYTATKTALCPKITAEFLGTLVADHNTSVGVLRRKGVSFLYTWNFDAWQFFVHHGANWAETVGADAVDLWRTLVRKQHIPNTAPCSSRLCSWLRSVVGRRANSSTTPVRQVLPSEYDQGYFRLYPDGSFTTHFRNRYFLLRTERAYAEIDMQKRKAVFPRSGESPANSSIVDATLLLHCLSTIATETCPRITNEFVRASAANSNTFVVLRRTNGISHLHVGRSRKYREFVHDGKAWFTSDDPEDVGLFYIELLKRRFIADEVRSRTRLRSLLPPNRSGSKTAGSTASRTSNTTGDKR